MENTSNLQIVKLHENKHLFEQCIELLNEEWPRKESHRLRTLNQSCDHFPMCLALVDQCSVVLGYVKLRNEKPFISSIFVESLVVRKSHRRQGLGRRIMEHIEDIARQLGFAQIRLTTTDQEEFYARLGYRKVHGKHQNFAPASIPSGKREPGSAPIPPPLPCSLPVNGELATPPILMYKDTV